MQTDNLSEADRVILRHIKEVNTGRVGRVAISYKGNILIIFNCADSFIHGDGGWQSGAGGIDMVSGDSPTFRGNKEKGIRMVTSYFNIGFIPCLDIIGWAFMMQIKLVAVIGGVLRVIKNGLVRNSQSKYMVKNKGGFSGRYAKGYMESEGKAKSIKGASNLNKRGNRHFLRSSGG